MIYESLNIAIKTLKKQKVSLNEERIHKEVAEFLKQHEWVLNQMMNVTNDERKIDHILAEINVINYGRAISFLTYLSKLHANKKISTQYLKLETQRSAHDILCKGINMNPPERKKKTSKQFGNCFKINIDFNWIVCIV